MPYQLCIWDPQQHAPLPATADEAIDAMERLSNIEDKWFVTLSQLVDGLIQRYQDDPHAAKEAGGFQQFWGSDPRASAAACHSAVYRLTLPDEPCLRHMSYVIGAAAELGLAVVDDDNGMYFQPDGTVLPEDTREMWEYELQEMRAGPPDPSVKTSDGRTFWERLAGDAFDALTGGRRR